MYLRLRANQDGESLAAYLHRDNAPSVRELDLTDCVLLVRGEWPALIVQCSYLTTLRCLGCGFQPTDIITLLWRLRHLVVVEFSLLLETDAQSELQRMAHAVVQYGSDAKAPSLRRMYVEVGYVHAIFLPVLLRSCPYLHNLQVHFSGGIFWYAFRLLHDAIVSDDSVEIITFTAELSAPVQLDPRAPLDLTSCAAICSNVTHSKSTGSFSVVRLADLADDVVQGRPPRILPVQMILVAVHHEGDITEKWIRMASQGHDWAHVRQLCLLLLAPDPACIQHPMASITYRNVLFQFFSTALSNIVELNLSLFHFGPDLDFGWILREVFLVNLKSLSASLCGLRSASTLDYLSHRCPFLDDLDVRVLGTCGDAAVPCACCDTHWRRYIDGVRGDEWGPLFYRRLRRLTLADIADPVWLLWFVDSCGPTDTVRICNTPRMPDYVILTRALARKSMPTSLVLRHDHLRFDDPSLLHGLRSIVSLQYLYLISAVYLPLDVVLQCVRGLSAGLPHLLCVHVHWRGTLGDTDVRRVTWMRLPDPRDRQGVLQVDGPCFQSCSTATFIGLAKPLYHEVQPMV
ncbi:hypothetical protein HPB51_006149 [Rhipicephalus microplus]|uniref:Uncharacterized protein n=1 Tax=Rhipicephalus microplus TaxID=6941 RepID=A0A9J6ES31_RHIMP|nr:uncharacterized protein LOC119180007 [Rhipicephalus microplus]KAH8036880.1 hypothetical protein HPB51_006149 [Rhipicephalus microplus]